MTLNFFRLGSATTQSPISLPASFMQRGLRWWSSLAWILALLMRPIAVEAQYAYAITNSTVTITHYTGPGGAVTIPATIAGLPVTSIGMEAFFYATSLTNVTVPDSVSSIGVGAFSDCTSLTSVTLGNSVTNIGDTAFFSCISLAGLAIPNSVMNIGFEAFYACSSLTSVTIPSSVTTIGSEAFGWCTRLTSVTIPMSLTSISDDAFDSCANLSVITVDTLNPFYSSLAGVLFNKSQTTLIQCPAAKAGTYAVPNGVTSIAASTFHNCNSLTNVTIPNSVTNIGESAFESCANLNVITVAALNPVYSSLAGVLFNKSQTTLIQCPGATTGTYVVPNSVTSIGRYAFIGCPSLTAIAVDPLSTSYSSLAGVLFNNSQTTLIKYPAAKAGTYAVPNSVTSIGDYAFISCSRLTSVTLPNSVTGIGVGAFNACTSLTNVTIANSVTSIGAYAFEACISLASVTIPNSVTSIGIFAFYQCTSLASVTIPNSVTTILDRTFESCTSLTTATIGNAITNIGSLAFAFCTDLTSVYFKGNAPAADSTALGNENATVYYLPGTAGWGATFAGRPTSLWNLQVQTGIANFGVRTNRFGFNITGPTNGVVVVEACTNLASPIWSPLQTNTLTGGYAYFSDPQWTNYPGRFYRLHSP